MLYYMGALRKSRSESGNLAARVRVEAGVMNKFLLTALGVAAAIAAPLTAATASADEVLAPVAPSQIAWGAANNNLQLGVRFDGNLRLYRRGETAKFALVARNTGKKSVNFKYRSPLFPVPFVTDEKGETRVNSLKSPPPLGYPVSEATLALAPGAQREIEKTELRIGAPLKQTLFWALDGAPGKYRVGFEVSLQSLSDQINQKLGRAPLILKSGFLALEIAPLAKPVSATAPTQGAEFAARLPPGALVKAAPYNWGREVNGLQLGIRLEVPGEPIPATKPVPLGTLVRFGLAVRNVSKTPLKVNYQQWQWSISPRVTTEAGEQLSVYAQINLFGAARNGQTSLASKTLEAGEAIDFGRAWLSVGAPADKEYSDPTLTVEPGRYRVRYSYDFTPDYHPKSAVKDPATGRMMVPPKDEADVTSSEIILEVAPAKSDSK